MGDIIDFETLVLDRLLLCNQSIEGLKSVYRLPPDGTLSPSAVPCAYTLVGPMLNSIPSSSPGQVTVTRRYVVRVPIAPIGQASVSGGAEGSIPYAQGVLFMARFRSFYLQHPRLDTEIEPRLSYMDSDLTFQDSGIIERPVPGGAPYWVIDFSLDISMRDNQNVYRVN